MTTSSVQSPPPGEDAEAASGSPTGWPARVVALARGKFVSSALVYVGGNVLQRFAGLLLTPLFVSVFTTAEYGAWGVLVTLIGVSGMLMDVGVRGSVLRFYYDYYQEARRLESYLSLSAALRIGTIVVAGLALTGVLGATWPWLLDGAVPFHPFGWLVVLVAAGNVLTEYVCGLFQAQRQAGLFVGATLSRTILQLTGSALFVLVFDWGVLGAVLGQMAGSLLVGLVAIGQHIAQHPLRPAQWHREDLQHNLSYGLPLVPHKVASWMRNASDRLILVQFVTMSALGVYHFGYAIGTAFSIVILSLDLAFTPIYFQLFKEHGGEAKPVVAQSVHVYTAILTAAAFALMLSASGIVRVIGGEAYADAAAVVPLIVVSFLFNGQYTVMVKPLFYHKRTHVLPWLTGLPGVLSIGLNLLLVPRVGVMGAVWVTFITYLGTLIAVVVIAQRVDRMPYQVGRLVLLNAAATVMALVLTYPPAWAEAFDTTGGRIALWVVAAAAIYVVAIRPNAEGARRLLRLAE